MNQFVIVIRGAPASGKSTIAKSYRDFGKRIVWLKVDNFKDFFSDDSTAALDFVNGSAIATLGYLLDRGFSVVVEGVFQNPRVMEEAFSAAVMLGIPCVLCELVTPLTVLINRDKTRPGVKERMREPIDESELTRISDHLERTSRKDSLKLDTDQLSLEECKKILDDAVSEWGKKDREPFSRGAFCFFLKDNSILLGFTTYGPKINIYQGFGGHVEEDELPEEAVVREVKEEIDVVIRKSDLEKVAVLTDHSSDEITGKEKVFEITMFVVKNWEGEPKELPGLKPEWFNTDTLPYDRMHSGARDWMEKIIAGKKVKMVTNYVIHENKESEIVERSIDEVNTFT